MWGWRGGGPEGGGTGVRGSSRATGGGRGPAGGSGVRLAPAARGAGLRPPKVGRRPCEVTGAASTG
ncbi:hypothetical protein DTB58_39710, partial [Streptomyces griseus]|nr:hypothetical protein [Streptomyces griseus]